MRPTEQIADVADATRAILRSGVLRPERPARLLRMARTVRKWGPGVAALFGLGAARYGDRPALVDERGRVSFSELDARTDAVARGLIESGIRAGDSVAILCRNHRYFFEIVGALAKLGVDAVYLNTAFAAPQVADVMRRERSVLLVHDDEFAALAIEAGIDHRLRAWTDDESTDVDVRTLDDLAQRHAHGPELDRPANAGRTIILTSGTTGPPKGALVAGSPHVGAGIALLERLPYRAHETMVIAAPCFHAWGWANASTSLLIGDTMVLERHFDPEHTLDLIARHRAEVLVAIPVMLLRIMELPADVRAPRHVVVAVRAAVGIGLARRPRDALHGRVRRRGLQPLRLDRGRVGVGRDARRPPRRTDHRRSSAARHDGSPARRRRPRRRARRERAHLREGPVDVLRLHRRRLARRSMVDGFMHTGDTGHFDRDGRLFVDGRDDEMIVSGGENVFPHEVEDVIARHPDVVEAAVIGVPDPEFGARLKAFVVARAGASLDAEAVRDYVRANLARFKVPREVEFVDELPATAPARSCAASWSSANPSGASACTR